jgi:hypothetical protein
VKSTAAVFLLSALAGGYTLARSYEHHEPPVSAVLLGCMDFESAQVTKIMEKDAFEKYVDPADFDRNFAYARWRAMSAAEHAQELRRCYLSAQTDSADFDVGGLMNEDVTRIEQGVIGLYELVGANVVRMKDAPEEKRSPDDKARSAAAMTEKYHDARSAADRLSGSLGILMDRYYL